MTRQEMMNKVMNTYGLESQVTLSFCEIAENWKSDEAVENMFTVAMMIGIEEEEEE